MRNRLLLVFSLFVLLSQVPLCAQQTYGEFLSMLDSLRQKNAVGTKAPDFKILVQDEDVTSLYDINSELTLLFLYHPDCYSCILTIQALTGDEHFNALINQKKMKVLAVDLTEDMLSITEGMRPPKGWTLCFDIEKVITNDLLYFVEDYPGLYLLDKQKAVLKKDVPPIRLLEYLKENYPL